MRVASQRVAMPKRKETIYPLVGRSVLRPPVGLDNGVVLDLQYRMKFGT